MHGSMATIRRRSERAAQHLGYCCGFLGKRPWAIDPASLLHNLITLPASLLHNLITL